MATSERLPMNLPSQLYALWLPWQGFWAPLLIICSTMLWALVVVVVWCAVVGVGVRLSKDRCYYYELRNNCP